MARIEILVEERSMKEFLTVLLPNILDNKWKLNGNYFIRKFEGKTDLQKNIPSKVKFLSNWNREAVGVIIMQDQDSSDCKILKKKLLNICNQNGDCPTLVRIICRELESWYIGDLEAVQKAYPNFKHDNYRKKAKFRIPDNCNAFDEIRKIVPEFQKVEGAKKIAPFINIEKNKSQSFQQTIHGLKRFFESIKD